ncbi:crossover junction endodeoxyribonuclease RuvC [Pirellulaceae bacterium SH501]
MTRRVVAISLSPVSIGVAGFDLVFGQYNLPSGGKAKAVGSSSLAGAKLLELHNYLDKHILSERRYDVVAIQSSQYGINVKSFNDAEAIARMTGVVLMASARHKMQLFEFAPDAVSKMAIGRKGASAADYVQAAGRNGVEIKINSQLAAEAYWIMCLASNQG